MCKYTRRYQQTAEDPLIDFCLNRLVASEPLAPVAVRQPAVHAMGIPAWPRTGCTIQLLTWQFFVVDNYSNQTCNLSNLVVMHFKTISLVFYVIWIYLEAVPCWNIKPFNSRWHLIHNPQFLRRRNWDVDHEIMRQFRRKLRFPSTDGIRFYSHQNKKSEWNSPEKIDSFSPTHKCSAKLTVLSFSAVKISAPPKLQPFPPGPAMPEIGLSPLRNPPKKRVFMWLSFSQCHKLTYHHWEW